jgi:hypothetical protein
MFMAVSSHYLCSKDRPRIDSETPSLARSAGEGWGGGE